MEVPVGECEGVFVRKRKKTNERKWMAGQREERYL